MSEDSMLMCLICFVLGYLVSRMIRVNGLSVGGRKTGDGNHGEDIDRNLRISDFKCPDNSTVIVDDSEDYWGDCGIRALVPQTIRCKTDNICPKPKKFSERMKDHFERGIDSLNPPF